MLDFHEGEDDSAGGRRTQEGDLRGGKTDNTAEQDSSKSLQEAKEELEKAAQELVDKLLKKIAEELEEQIEDGAVELESFGQQVTIRIRENGSFPSGSAYLQPQFKPVIRKIGELLTTLPGEIMVSGNTDNRGVDSELFSSNWDLSSKRAVAIAHELIKVNGFSASRLSVVGHADTRPLVPSTTIANRRKNRRVEISINQGKATQTKPIEVLQ
jgi:chemotaxis protein MotB